MKTNLRFIIAAYGQEYSEFLLPNLYSVYKNHPDAAISVFWSDIPIKDINWLKIVFPNIDFIEVNFPINGNIMQRIPFKMKLWNEACKKYSDENLCFLDCDTIMVKPIASFLNDTFDILFTWKN